MEKEALEARMRELTDAIEKAKANLMMLQGARMECQRLLDSMNPAPSA